jgi:hypothetical protein
MEGPGGRRARELPPAAATNLIDEADASLLDLVDNLLAKGVVVTGEVTLGVANVDLIHLRLSLVLAASDKLWPRGPKP